MLLLDLVRVIRISTITDKDCTSLLLGHHDFHLTLNPCNNIEILDIKDVITIQLLHLVDGLRIGCSLQECEYLSLLLGTLDVSLCSCFIFCDVSIHALNTLERNTSYAIKNDISPAGISLNELRNSVEIVILREEHIHISNSIVLVNSSLGRSSHTSKIN